jgi:hypothetical protein
MRRRKRATNAAGFERHFAEAFLVLQRRLGAKKFSRQAAMFTAGTGEKMEKMS